MAAVAEPGVRATLYEIRTPLSVYVPVAGLLLWLSLTRSPSALAIPANALAGLALWTAMEYVIHRFVLHLMPRGSFRRFLSGRHVMHHRDPAEHPGLISPTVSLPVAAGFFALAALAVGTGHAAATSLGVVLGYLLYEYTHLAIHLGAPSLTPWGAALSRHHMIHHHGHARANFAILVPAWDGLWHTRRRSER